MTPFAILPVTSSHLHILILLVLIKVGWYSNHLYLDKIRDVHNSLVGIAVVDVAVVVHCSSLFSMMERNNTELQIQRIASVLVKVRLSVKILN